MLFKLLFQFLLAMFRSRQSLALENAALRHQLEVLLRNSSRPNLRWPDRAFWDILCLLWPDWRKALFIVQPDTVFKWHRQGFRLYWRWLSRPRRPGRPKIPLEVRNLIREMSLANPLWGAPRIHGELLKLGLDVCETTIANYMARHTRPPSQSWRTFLINHSKDIASIDFFTLPTATFRVLYVFLVLDNAKRRVLHFNVTQHPTAAWTGQQVVEALPWDTAPRYMIRDRDGIYGENFRRRVEAMGIEQVLTSPRSPWQNPYVERVIGSIRRECLDHMIIFNEQHLRRVLRQYLDYYHRSRTHLGLAKDCPVPRAVEPPEVGSIKSEPVLGGLHHRYFRQAA